MSKKINPQLMHASREGHNEIVKLLIDRGDDVNAVDEDGYTALMKASCEGHNEIVKLLLDAGADVNAAAADGVTALIYASWNNYTEIVKLLIDKGANVNAVNAYGSTALMKASWNGYTETVKLLTAAQRGTMKDDFITKDSGERVEFPSGMVRDIQEGKPRYDLCDKVMYKRWALLMSRGADKYGANNWKKANSEEELSRFKASAERHLMQYLEGDQTEDHAAAVMFNLAAAEYLRNKLGEANNG